MSSVIEQIDSNLEKYYKVHGIDNYRNAQGIGKFQLWAEDNGMGSDAIIDEIETADPTDSVITDIDDQFPLENTTNQDQQIFEIIKKCHKFPNAVFYKLYKFKRNLDKQFFDIDEKEVVKTKELYSNQCASIMNSGMLNDTGLFNVITIGRKNGFPYMQHLTDTFSRDRLAYYCQYRNSTQWSPALDVDTWADEKNSPLFRNIEDKKQRTQHMQAIRSYYSRLVPKLMFTNYTKIKDSVEQTARYITSAALFVNELSQSQKMFPFQLDIIIGYKNARVEEKFILPDSTSDDDEKDDEKDDDDKVNWFGDVKNKLDSNHLTYVEQEIDESKDKEQYTLGASGRAFSYPFRELKQKLCVENFPHGRRLCCFVDRTGDDQDKNTILMYEPPDNCKYIPPDNVSLWYLSASRSSIIPNKQYDGDIIDAVNGVAFQVCKIIMDRDRKKGINIKPSDYACTLAKGKNKKEIKNGVEFDIIVKIKKIYYKIIVQRINIPSMKYILKDDKIELEPYFTQSEERIDIEQQDIKSKQKFEKQNIKSNDHCKGHILTVSFHAIEKDKIKCYLYYNGQVTRFFPETDIKILLPLFFDETYDNENALWSKGDDVKRYTDSLSGTIRDQEFEAFYEKYKSSFIKKKRKDSFLSDNIN